MATVVALIALTRPEAAQATTTPPAFPAAGTLDWPAVRVRSAPSFEARSLALVFEFRRDYYPTVIHAVAARRDQAGRLWYRVRLAGRPNDRTGWVPAASLGGLRHVKERIKIDRSARRLTVFRQGRAVFKTTVAVGKPGAETPVGNFYITLKFRPTWSVLGVYALETSAYSRLSDWPGGGVVGLHGTYQPHLLGQAVSHGCVRLSNYAVLRVRDLVPVGAPLEIVP